MKQSKPPMLRQVQTSSINPTVYLTRSRQYIPQTCRIAPNTTKNGRVISFPSSFEQQTVSSIFSHRKIVSPPTSTNTTPRARNQQSEWIINLQSQNYQMQDVEFAKTQRVYSSSTFYSESPKHSSQQTLKVPKARVVPNKYGRQIMTIKEKTEEDQIPSIHSRCLEQSTHQQQQVLEDPILGNAVFLQRKSPQLRLCLFNKPIKQYEANQYYAQQLDAYVHSNTKAIKKLLKVSSPKRGSRISQKLIDPSADSTETYKTSQFIFKMYFIELIEKFIKFNQMTKTSHQLLITQNNSSTHQFCKQQLVAQEVNLNLPSKITIPYMASPSQVCLDQISNVDDYMIKTIEEDNKCFQVEYINDINIIKSTYVLPFIICGINSTTKNLMLSSNDYDLDTVIYQDNLNERLPDFTSYSSQPQFFNQVRNSLYKKYDQILLGPFQEVSQITDVEHQDECEELPKLNPQLLDKRRMMMKMRQKPRKTGTQRNLLDLPESSPKSSFAQTKKDSRKCVSSQHSYEQFDEDSILKSPPPSKLPIELTHYTLQFQNQIMYDSVLKEGKSVKTLAQLFIESNMLTELQNLIRLNPNFSINSHNKDGRPYMIIAAQSGYLDIVKYMIEQGVNIDVQDVQYLLISSKKLGNTALHYASIYNHNQLADYLISMGANQFTKNRKHQTMWCLQSYQN